MAFPESVTKEIKRRAHFQCCLCKALGIEVHHIIPQAEKGPDVAENGAPLCPSCHETYGANPTKRKLIREARDLWYEICQTRYASEPSLLREVKGVVTNTASKEDVSNLRTEIERVLDRLKPPGCVTINVPRRIGGGPQKTLDASDLMLLVYGFSSDRPVGQLEMLCIREFWPLKDGVRSIYKEFIQNFGSVTLRRLAARALDSAAVLPREGITESEIAKALSLMHVEAACLNLLVSGELRASLTSSGEVLWVDADWVAP